jgi:hypothetical protein
MIVALNTMVKNEGTTLKSVLPIWKKYEVDYYIFYDDNSTDNTIDVIYEILPNNKVIIINDNLPEFNEGYNRQKMIDKSRELGVDYIISLDSDELLSTSITKDFKNFLSIYDTYDLYLFWYNVVGDSLMLYRSDPLYENNFRCFVLPVKHIGNLDTTQWKYHTPRTPTVNLPRTFTKDYGIIHLQSANKKYYAIKQLWYKHHEFVKYNHDVPFINGRYDPVVNGLNFNPQFTPQNIIDGIDIDLSFFNRLEEEKGYTDFIKKHYNEDLITFGKEYIIWR